MQNHTSYSFNSQDKCKMNLIEMLMGYLEVTGNKNGLSKIDRYNESVLYRYNDECLEFSEMNFIVYNIN